MASARLGMQIRTVHLDPAARDVMHDDEPSLKRAREPCRELAVIRASGPGRDSGRAADRGHGDLALSLFGDVVPDQRLAIGLRVDASAATEPHHRTDRW